MLARLRELLLVSARETSLFGDRNGEVRLQQRNAIAGLAFSDQEGQLVLFRPPLELGGLLPVVSLLLPAIRDVRLEGGGQTLALGLIFLDLRGKLLAFKEHLLESFARVCLSFFEPGAFLPVLSLPPLTIRDMRLEGGGQALPFGVRLLDLRGEMLAFGERLGELLARRGVSVFERGTFLPVLRLPPLSRVVVRLEGGGQPLPFRLRLLDLRGQALPFGDRLCELLVRRSVSVFERGTFLPGLRLPPLARAVVRLEGGGQTLAFGLVFLDLRGKLLAFKKHLLESFARVCLSFFEPGAFLPVLSLPPLTIRDMRLEGGGQALPFGVRLLDLRGEMLAFGERLCELLARRSVSVFERGTFLPVLRLPPLARVVVRLEGGGQPLPFSLRLLDLRGEVIVFGQRLCELLARRCLSRFERGAFLPVLSLPLLTLFVLRFEGRGQPLPFRLGFRDLRGEMLAFGERLCELLARAFLAGFELGTFLPVLRLPLLARVVVRLEGGGQPLPFRLGTPRSARPAAAVRLAPARVARWFLFDGLPRCHGQSLRSGGRSRADARAMYHGG